LEGMEPQLRIPDHRGPLRAGRGDPVPQGGSPGFLTSVDSLSSGLAMEARILLADTVTPEVRSRMMAAIKGKNTKPELAIRRGLHALGFRYSLHSARMPGKPDIVLPKHRAVVF